MMKSWFRFASFIFVLLIASTSSADGTSKVPSEVLEFKHKIDQLLSHSCLRKKEFGALIYSLDRKETLYSRNSERLLIPASNLKLVTTALALKELGPDFRFETNLYSDGKIEGDHLIGDLYIKGFGDPKLVTEQMWLLANQLKNVPIRKITGNIIADDSYFDRQRRVKTWKSNPGAQAYNAPLGALSFNFNTVTAFIQPGKKAGDKPVVMVEPETRYIRLSNVASTIGKNEKAELWVNRVDQKSHDQVTVSGTIRENQKRATYYLNITDPTNYAVNVFKEYLERAGVEVTGNTQNGTVPPKAKRLVRHESEPIALALRGLNKFSNNFVAEQILKTLAAKRFGPPGTTENGLKFLRDYMQSIGVSSNEYKIVDASGLSKQNRLSPAHLVAVLKDMHSDLSVYPEFVSALGIMGLDGNVKNRMRGIKEAQKARVKTGTLNRVNSLSGYFQSQDGEQFAFSILMNELKCSHSQARGIQDKIIHQGLKFKRLKNSIEGEPR